MKAVNLYSSHEVQASSIGHYVWSYWFKHSPRVMIIDLRNIAFK